MKNELKIFVAYFPLLLLGGQVVCNLLYFIAPDSYYSFGFYLNLFFGTNLFFALFLVAITNLFKLCEISRFAAYAQLLFAVIYLFIKEDNIYNILLQIVIGFCVIAIALFQSFKKPIY